MSNVGVAFTYDGHAMYELSGFTYYDGLQDNAYAHVYGYAITSGGEQSKVGVVLHTADTPSVTCSTDVNGLGGTEITDARLVSNVYNNTYTLTEETIQNILRANCNNKDAVVSIADATAVKRDIVL